MKHRMGSVQSPIFHLRLKYNVYHYLPTLTAFDTVLPAIILFNKKICAMRLSLTAFLFLLLATFFAACSKDSDGAGIHTDGIHTDPDSKSGGFLDASGGFAGEAASGGSSAGGSSSNNDPIPAGQLTAGEWNDLDNWAFWKDLHSNDTIEGYQTYWKFQPDHRYRVQVANNDGSPVVDGKVELLDNGGNVIWQARTDNFGKAELWANLYEDNSEAAYLIVEGATAITNPSEETVNYVVLNTQQAASQLVEVAFVVDATGSMGDEITYLQNELTDVLNRIQFSGSGLDVRASSVFYRDLGDEYLTTVSQFTSNFSSLQAFVNGNKADGGGDFPEAVDAAMDVAIHQLDWSETARTRIVFLILDAPPHHEDQAIASLQQSIRDAAAKGIKVIPVVASGIDKETEFLMRYFAIATNGTYVFITNHSGIGNEHIEPTVGDYEVEFLNDLMVRLVKKYSDGQ